MKSKKLRQYISFAFFGALMFTSKLLLEFLPNVHLLGMFTVLLTVVYRVKALIPIYIYVMLNGVYAGFNAWWVPYLYIWTILWGLAMLIPKRTPKAVRAFIYPILCSLHGFAFGILYAPAEAIMFGLSFEEMLVWIAAGATFDIIHGISNFVAGFLVLPLSELLFRLEGNSSSKKENLAWRKNDKGNTF